MQMRLKLIKVSRRPAWPWWAAGICAAWLSMVSAAVRLWAARGVGVSLCAFKQLTGLACPTCGAWRGLQEMLGGRVAAAWLHNPLLFTLLGLWVVTVPLRVVFARAVRVELTARGRRAAWLTLTALMLANWAYVIRFVR